MVVLTELRNHRVADVFFLVCDGLKGLPDSVNAVWPATIMQTSFVHIGAGGRVPLVTCATPVRTCANQLPSRSRCRPVRPGWWRALYLPAGAAPGERRDEVPMRPAERGGMGRRTRASWCPITVNSIVINNRKRSYSREWTGEGHSTSSAC
jgi:hypothetical protein